MTVEFELEGQRFVALNGGPHFTFSPAISFVVDCKTQAEVNSYWEKLSARGDETAQQCGWLQDKFGLPWQIVPSVIGEHMGDKDPEKSGRVMTALLKMKKLDIAKLRQASSG
jgi:predicted 3-demethylubiquinone-9 3-methyltransferase (glyoxalase superfamily)